MHDIPRRTHCSILFNNDKQSYYILLSDFQIRQNEAWVITYQLSQINNALRLYLRLFFKGIRELLNTMLYRIEGDVLEINLQHLEKQ